MNSAKLQPLMHHPYAPCWWYRLPDFPYMTRVRVTYSQATDMAAEATTKEKGWTDETQNAHRTHAGWRDRRGCVRLLHSLFLPALSYHLNSGIGMI